MLVQEGDAPGLDCYDLPLVTPWLARWVQVTMYWMVSRRRWASYVPCLPSYGKWGQLPN